MLLMHSWNEIAAALSKLLSAISPQKARLQTISLQMILSLFIEIQPPLDRIQSWIWRYSFVGLLSLQTKRYLLYRQTICDNI